MKKTFMQTGYFHTPLFNEVTHTYLYTVFANLVNDFTLTSAKGGSGWTFRDKPDLFAAVQRLPDMPYHMHILNGLFPALKLLEKEAANEENRWAEDMDFPNILRAFLLGFTLHDTNKLVDKDLRVAALEDVERLCHQFQAERFFPDWQQWLSEIQFFILRTENGDNAFSYNDYGKSVRQFDFLNKNLGEFCHIADRFASLEFDTGNHQEASTSKDAKPKKLLRDTSDLFQTVENVSYRGQKLKDKWPLSYVAVSENVFTLLSQKLLNNAQKFVQTVRKEDILLHTRQGFVFLGKPLEAAEKETVIKLFLEDESTFSALKMSKIDRQQVAFGFGSYRGLEAETLNTIIQEGYFTSNEKDRLKFFYAKDAFVNPARKECQLLQKAIAQHGLPFELKATNATANKDAKKRQYFFAPQIDEQAWEKLRLFALQKIKFIKRTENPKTWGKEYEEAKERLTEFLGESMNIDSDNRTNLATLVAISDISKAVNLKDICDLLAKEVADHFSKSKKTEIKPLLEEFALTYLTGNFTPDIQRLFEKNRPIPTKGNMCLFTGAAAETEYEDAVAHGVGARKFSNRTINNLATSNPSHHISPLFLAEIEIRKWLRGTGKDTDNSACIYFDFGEFIVPIDARQIFDLFATVKNFDYDREWRIDVDGKKFNFNYFGLFFEEITNGTKEQFEYVLKSLRLIEKTAFRLYTTSIISPYHAHRETFLFDSCLPYIRAVGWESIRLDEVGDRRKELELLSEVGGKRLNGTLLDFAKERRAVFSAFRQMDEKDRRKNQLEKRFLHYCLTILPRFHHQHYDMSTMKNLADLAIRMAHPQGDSSAQETKIIRSALDVLKACKKEGRDRLTTIGQIMGDLRQLAKTYRYFDESFAMEFAQAVWDQLFVKTWARRIPPPGRLRHWVNEFAVWYSLANDLGGKQKHLEAARTAMADGELTEDKAIDWLRTSEYNKNKAVTNYEWQYRLAFQKFFSAESSI